MNKYLDTLMQLIMFLIVIFILMKVAAYVGIRLG
jgi:hypothetical protein